MLFVHGLFEETIYMTQPLRIGVGDRSPVCKLNQAFHGLKQASKQWFDELKSKLLQFGFLDRDSSLFIYKIILTLSIL